MPSLNILFYTDHVSMLLPDGNHGISRLKNLLENRQPAFVTIRPITVTNRFEDSQHPNRLTDELLNQFDEIWIFGKYQAKVNGKFGEQYGGPENELDDDEVRALGKWTKKGGVLITGDHSQINLPRDGSNIDKIYCRGRALGHRVPRARRLRVWEGAPMRDTENFNTLVKVGDKDPDKHFELQNDSTPQKIKLVAFGLDASPHPIFQGKRQTIEIFPDHMHEGEAVAPNEEELAKIPELIEEEWPKVNGKLHEPKIAAYGFDKRSTPPQQRGVIAVYDGDPVERGRIVADSSWHHYVNTNLSEFADDGDDSTMDLMAQFYSNLAVWLAPREIRKEMSRAMFKWLTTHPDVEEEIGSSATRLGEAGLYYLTQVATRCEINELIHAAFPDTPGAGREPLLFPSENLGLTFLPSQELVLGSIIDQFQRQAFTVVPLETSDAAPDPMLEMSDDELAAEGLGEAFRLHAERVNRIAYATHRNSKTYMSAIKRDAG